MTKIDKPISLLYHTIIKGRKKFYFPCKPIRQELIMTCGKLVRLILFPQVLELIRWRLTLPNPLAYYAVELITVLKSFSFKSGNCCLLS